jgi:hypothetical protein
MDLSKELNDEIWEYCRTNNIPNIDGFKLKLLKQGFTVEKFGATPTNIKEKIVEKIVEVEKEVYITNDTETESLTIKITDLTAELEKVKAELELEKNKKKRDIYGE